MFIVFPSLSTLTMNIPFSLSLSLSLSPLGTNMAYIVVMDTSDSGITQSNNNTGMSSFTCRKSALDVHRQRAQGFHNQIFRGTLQGLPDRSKASNFQVQEH
jgi:hypothetical protein